MQCRPTVVRSMYSVTMSSTFGGARSDDEARKIE
jgi:hypothetical protein